MSLPKGSVKKSLNSVEVQKTPFVLFQSHPDDFAKISSISNKDYIGHSPLREYFFSKKNMDSLQKMIINAVYKQSRGRYQIERQSSEDLLVVMNYVFDKYAQHGVVHIEEQILNLNNQVLAEVVPDILSRIEFHFSYLNRAFGSVQPLDRPINVSNAGRKTLPSFSSRI